MPPDHTHPLGSSSLRRATVTSSLLESLDLVDLLMLAHFTSTVIRVLKTVFIIFSSGYVTPSLQDSGSHLTALWNSLGSLKCQCRATPHTKSVITSVWDPGLSVVKEQPRQRINTLGPAGSLYDHCILFI